jgi:soluble lytic murein transglycosylase
MRARSALTGLAGVVITLLLSAGGGAEAGTLFRFEDDRGTVHYTNVPSDPRYRFYRDEPEAEPPAAGSRVPIRRGLAMFAEAIRAAAERYRVDHRLIEAVIRVESGGNPGAVSPKGALGLMQLMPQRAAELGVRNPFNPIENLDGGVRHLRDLLERFGGNLTHALAAYNAGEAAVRTHQGVPPYAETRDYVRKVRALYEGPGLASGPTPAAATPQQVYTQVAQDGVVTYTNLPPVPRPLVPRSF